MSFDIKALHGGGLQVEDPAGHWVIFSLDDLRSHSRTLRVDMVEGAPALPPEKADRFVWSAFAATRGYAIEHGLVGDDRPQNP